MAFSMQGSRTILWKKVNFPENTLYYLNKWHLNVKKNKQILLWTFFHSWANCRIFKHASGHILLHNKVNEVKMIRPQYDPETGEFKGLYETIGCLVVRGLPEEIFCNYGYDREKSKVLYSQYRRRIPNFFSGTIFNRHKEMIERWKDERECSNFSSLP